MTASTPGTPGTPAAPAADSAPAPTVLLVSDGAPSEVGTGRRRARVVPVSPEEADDVAARLAREGAVVAVVGLGEAGGAAITVAARLGVTRLALVAVPAPDNAAEQEVLADRLAAVTAKVLIMNGQRDPRAANRDAGWFKDRLASARVEMVPPAQLVDGQLGLDVVWDRVLQHCGAPVGRE